MLYLVKIFAEETDDAHKLIMPEIIQKLAANGNCRSAEKDETKRTKKEMGNPECSKCFNLLMI